MEPAIATTKKCLAFLLAEMNKYNKEKKTKITFNLVSFGSHFETLFAKSALCTDETATIAKNYASRLRADYGGIQERRKTREWSVIDLISIYLAKKKN
jgi:hypothetical protein